MELKLSRVDYMQVGLTSPKTTRLLPSMGGLSQQKVRISIFLRIMHKEGMSQVKGMASSGCRGGSTQPRAQLCDHPLSATILNEN